MTLMARRRRCSARTAFAPFRIVSAMIILFSIMLFWYSYKATDLMFSQSSSPKPSSPQSQQEEAHRQPRYDPLLPKKMKSRFNEYNQDIAKMHALMAPLAINNTVIVVPTNFGFIDLALNLRCRLSHFGLDKNVLVWALDKKSADYFSSIKFPHFYDPKLFTVSGALGYGDEDYIKMMSERPKVWWKMLATGFDIFFMDADIVMFRDPFELLDRAPDTTMEAQIDEFEFTISQDRSIYPQVCAGFFWLRSDYLGLGILEKIIESYQARVEGRRWDDQIGMNSVLHDGFVPVRVLNRAQSERWKPLYNNTKKDLVVNLRFFEPYHALNGHMWHRVETFGKGDKTQMYIRTLRGDQDPTPPFEDFYKLDPDLPVIIRPHMLHLNGVIDKASLMRHHGWWVLGDNNVCLPASSFS